MQGLTPRIDSFGPYQLQDYTVVGSVGDVGQQMAGHQINVVEPGTTSGEVLALYKFGAGGGAITLDEKGTYPLTTIGTVTQSTGIMGLSNEAASSAGGASNYFESDTLLDTVPSAIALDFWFLANDGQPSTAINIFYKSCLNSSNRLYLFLGTDGRLTLWAHSPSATGGKSVTSTTVLPNNLTGWYHLSINWDTTNGVRMWVNGVLEGQDSTMTVLPSSGTNTNFQIMGYQGSNNALNGKLAFFRVRNKVLSQKDVDLAYSTKYTWASTAVGLENADMQLYTQEAGLSDFKSQLSWGGMEVARDVVNNNLYRYGGLFAAADKIKLIGRG